MTIESILSLLLGLFAGWASRSYLSAREIAAERTRAERAVDRLLARSGFGPIGDEGVAEERQRQEQAAADRESLGEVMGVGESLFGDDDDE